MNDTQQANFDELADKWRQLWLDNWATVTRSTVDSETFKNFNGAFFNWNLTTQKMFRDGVAQSLEAVDVPRRSDLARLSKQIASLESRLLEVQEEIERLATRDDIKRLEQLLKSTPKSAPKSAPKNANVPKKGSK
ncbi:MAG: hypothetical protein AB1758_00350 [Candidatus Eremiobacterota bacterium]